MKTIFRKYRVEKELGKGGMGIVYLAFDTVLERPVAIKTISTAQVDPILKKRFKREAQSTGKLRHNNIITIYDFGEDEDRLYIVMEYLEGDDLAALISQKKALDIKRNLEIIRQVCLGLNFAHENGIFHRDVKPANIMLLKDGSVKILDFGLAAIHSVSISNLSLSDAFLGTLNYTAPERLTGEDASGKTDQFAVGLIFYELLTHRSPFKGDSLLIIAHNIMNTEPQSLDPEILSRYPELDFIIKKAIEKDPTRRYPSLKDMAADIEALLNKMRRERFSWSSAIATLDEPMSQGQASLPGKKKELPLLRAVLLFLMVIVLLGLLALFYFSFLKKDAPAVLPGYLSFDVKPYASIEAIVDMKTNQNVLSGAESLTTPLRLKLKSGKYQIIYTHPQWGSQKRIKIVKITPGETQFERDWLNDNFIQKAVEHFSVSPDQR